MNQWFKIFVFLLVPVLAIGQQSPDSLKKNLKNAVSDSARYYSSRELFYYYQEANSDSALWFANQELLLSTRNNKMLNVAEALTQKGYALMHRSEFEEALQALLKAFAITENQKNEKNFWDADKLGSPHRKRLSLLAYVHQFYGILMGFTDNSEQEIFHYKMAKQIAAGINYVPRIITVDLDLANKYEITDKIDSALKYNHEAQQLAFQNNKERYLSFIFWVFGNIYLKNKDTALAKHYFYQGIRSGIKQQNLSALTFNYNSLTKYYISLADKDSSLYYSIKTLQTFQSIGIEGGTSIDLGVCFNNLYESYKLRGEFDSAFKYQGLTLVTQDSLYKRRIKSLAGFQNLNFSQQLKLKQLEEDQVKEQSKVRTIVLLAAVTIFILIAFLLFKNNRIRKKANGLLQLQKNELQNMLHELKNTQSQLIQQEKMASLGELTGGIAHEIQNPLNFVNNFSDVSNELVDEMNEELDKGEIQEAKLIAADIKQNLEKINHHGKRADAIVKGMLQHSRKSSGQKELTDINALGDEYLRLSYHGLRAKDKNFNAEIKTDFDESIGKINIIPQDIGRVLLNLFNNAFYAVNEQKNKNLISYEPKVFVRTQKCDDKIQITVRDNGNGIPQNIVDKIFQPFFTTKPTGQGTGLGLSLSYDIIKAHGGEIKVESKEGEGTEFIIQLPVI